MQLTVWTYEGPPHVGAMRIATSMHGVHYVIHAPQGDTYADLLFTMIERRDKRPPVTYSTFKARDLGGDTAGLIIETVRSAYERFKPEVLLVGESCTAELIQDQPGTLAQGMNLPIPVVSLELPAYSKKENWGASETFYYLTRTLLQNHSGETSESENASVQDAEKRRPSANILGPTAFGFRCRDDIEEIKELLGMMGVDVNVIAPWEASPEKLKRIPDADFNICLYPEIAQTTCTWLERTFKQPTVKTVPIGVGATRDFISEVGEVAGIDVSKVLERANSRLPWYSISIDSTYLTGKRVFIFGDATHVVAAARIASEELGFTVVGIGTYSRELAREVRAAAEKYSVEALITDDYLEVEAKVVELQPELVLGTQMERHIAKRLGIACAVISSPAHVQDFPARHSPQMGIEGANVIFDTWVHPLMMGLEEHLLTMFRGDFEFNDEAKPSHLGGAARKASNGSSATESNGHGANGNGYSLTDAPNASAGSDTDLLDNENGEASPSSLSPNWIPEAELELKKIPFFVRGKARRNTERYAADNGLSTITIDTLYDAKAHFGR